MLTLLQLLLVILIVIGILLACKEKNNYNKFNKKELLLPIFTAISIGFADTISKTSINNTSSFSFLIAIALVQIPVAFIYLKIKKQKIIKEFKLVKTDFSIYKYSLLGSLFNIIGTGLLYISFNYALVSIVSPITAAHSVLVVIYSVLILKEKTSTYNRIGILMTLFGVIVLSIYA